MKQKAKNRQKEIGRIQQVAKWKTGEREHAGEWAMKKKLEMKIEKELKMANKKCGKRIRKRTEKREEVER